MSYLAGFEKDQTAALRVSPDDLRLLSPHEKASLYLQHERIRSDRRAAFWNALAVAVTVAAPIAAFMGIKRFTKK